MNETPRFIQGVFRFVGAGLERPTKLEKHEPYRVPFDKRAQLVYLRAGNSTAEMVYVSLSRNERPLRLFPVGARGAIHVALAILEDLEPESEIELRVGAPEGVAGALLIDLGLLEI